MVNVRESMPTAMDGAYARYGHIVHPSLWDQVLDLCLGRGLADRLLIARLERAHQESVAALREAGEDVPLPGDNGQGDGSRDAPAETSQSLGNEDKPYFEPFFWDGWEAAFPAAREFNNCVLSHTAPDAAQDPAAEVDYSTWHNFEWHRRKRPTPPASRLSAKKKAGTSKNSDGAHGFYRSRNPKVSNLSKMILEPEEYVRDGLREGFAEREDVPAPAPKDGCQKETHQEDSGCAIGSYSDNSVPEEYLC